MLFGQHREGTLTYLRAFGGFLQRLRLILQRTWTSGNSDIVQKDAQSLVLYPLGKVFALSCGAPLELCTTSSQLVPTLEYL